MTPSTEQMITWLSTTVLDHPNDLDVCRQAAQMIDRLRAHSIILHTLVARIGDHVGEHVTIVDPAGGYMVHPVELLDGLLRDMQKATLDALTERDRARAQVIDLQARVALLTSALDETRAVL